LPAKGEHRAVASPTRFRFAAQGSFSSLEPCRPLYAPARIVSFSTPAIVTSRRMSMFERDASKAKFWLEPISLPSSSGFSRSELHHIQRLIVQHHALLLDRWHDYFDA
jgi:hypothetical protein